MITPLCDKAEITAMVNSPEIYRWLTDDLSPEVFVCDEALYLTNADRSGIVKIEQMNGVTAQVHIAVFRRLLGRTGEFVKDVLEWGFNNTTFMKVITFVPAYNRLALKLAQRSGFKEEGIVTKSFLKEWVLHDQYVYGITKEEFRRLRLCH
jgi:RimJ/RimL family protein N-acetyltransferase